MVTVARRQPAAVALGPANDAAGDFRALYDAHFAFVWRTLLHFGVPEAAAEDAAQEVFVTLYRRLDDYDPTRPLRSWLWGMCRRVAQTQRRSQARAAKRSESARPPTPSLPPDAALEQKQAVDFMQHFVQSLSDELRDVFVSIEIEGLRAAEVADVLELNVNTVYSRLRLARERFELARARMRAREARQAG